MKYMYFRMKIDHIRSIVINNFEGVARAVDSEICDKGQVIGMDQIDKIRTTSQSMVSRVEKSWVKSKN